MGLFLVPAIGAGDGWQLMPVLSLEMIRLTTELGGRLERDLRSAVLPIGAREQLLERINLHTLHAGPKQCLDSAGQLAQELSRELGVTLSPGLPRDARDRWGRLAVRRRSYKSRTGDGTAELELRAVTFPARGFAQRRLGSAPRDEFGAQPSAVMDLGEAVQTAVDAGLPLLLSTEAAGELKDTVRVGRMKGRPGMLTITSSDGMSASTRRVVAEQALGTLIALKRSKAKVTLSAGARQLVRMTMASPLADDPVLLGRQREMAALKVVGSGVDASAVGTGKTISSGRALAHRAVDSAAVPRAGRSPRGGCSGSGARSSPAARRAAGCRRWRRTSSCWCSPTIARSPGRSAGSTASSATGRAWCSPPTACSTATRPTCRRSRGIC